MTSVLAHHIQFNKIVNSDWPRSSAKLSKKLLSPIAGRISSSSSLSSLLSTLLTSKLSRVTLNKKFMETRIIDTADKSSKEIEEVLFPAIEDLKNGNPVAIPTETVYGLAANALNTEACRKIYETKNRPSDNPLIVHISSMEMLKLLVPSAESNQSSPKDILDTLQVPNILKPVLRKFWPGPLTVLLPKKENINSIVTAGLETVAVRYPSHPIAQRIIELCDFPLAAPSANLSGRPSPTTAQHVIDDLDGRISYIVDGGAAGFGLESTVLDATRDPPMILRPGSITTKMLGELIPNVIVYRKEAVSLEEAQKMEERPATPGMKYRHYSPSSPLILFNGNELSDPTIQQQSIFDFINDQLSDGKRISYLPLKRNGSQINHSNYREFPLSEDGSPEEIARNLFAALRAADIERPDLIVAQSVKEEDEGLAIMNRLSKAASMTKDL